MAGIRKEEKHFPLDKIGSVVNLFKEHLESDSEPDLAFLSIVLGCIENVLTSSKSESKEEEKPKWEDILDIELPPVQYVTVETLYKAFVTRVKASVDLSKYTEKHASRNFVKKVSDVIWIELSGNYQDKAHLQSLYSYITGNLNQ